MNPIVEVFFFLLAVGAIVAGEQLAKKAGIKSHKSDKSSAKPGADKKKH